MSLIKPIVFASALIFCASGAEIRNDTSETETAPLPPFHTQAIRDIDHHLTKLCDQLNPAVIADLEKMKATIQSAFDTKDLNPIKIELINYLKKAGNGDLFATNMHTITALYDQLNTEHLNRVGKCFLIQYEFTATVEIIAKLQLASNLEEGKATLDDVIKSTVDTEYRLVILMNKIFKDAKVPYAGKSS